MNQELDQIAPAFVAAQGEFLHAVRTTKGGHGKFAPLPEIIEMARPVLAAHGLGYTQSALADDRNGIAIRTTIVHTSGQTLSDDRMFVPSAKMDPQGFGSAMSYARRYGLLAVLGIATHDDDGSDALKAIERQENANEIVADTPRLTTAQAATLEAISAACGIAGRDRSDMIAEDFPAYANTAVSYAVKQGVIDKADAEKFLNLALACSVDEIVKQLAAVTA